ncbi:hypothetical protein COOONC_23166 [Cooperia oncophora]
MQNLFQLIISFGVIYSAKLTVYSEDDVQTAILFVIQVIYFSAGSEQLGSKSCPNQPLRRTNRVKIAVALLIFNRWRTKKSLGVGTKLSTRYQLVENIRVLKILLPVSTTSFTFNSKLLFHSQCTSPGKDKKRDGM